VSAAPEIRDVPERERYEILVDGEPAGVAVYRREPGTITFLHTEIDDRFDGQGLGTQLVAAALEDVAGRGLAVVPTCPFVAAYLRRHPEHAGLVPPEDRARFGLAAS
jgi:predicted GNAT family acetyltransferase